ncbi:MAG: hypothetical protein U0794_04345 [Isosphaeraceae bacterium]
MNTYWERVVSAETPVLRSSGTPVSEIIARFEAGETLAGTAATLNLQPLDLVAVLAHDALGETDDAGPSLVQTPPRRPKLEHVLTESAVESIFPAMRRPARLALAAGLLQIHDFWDPSHQAAQEADDLGETRVSAYWHGIGHRREPDAGNAAYWFRRVGRHAVFPQLAEAARLTLAVSDASQTESLLPQGKWDPFAFIDLCVRSKGKAAALARRLQRTEMILLLGASLPD